MTRLAIATDLNRCVGCLSCSAACKTVNDVQIGNFWTRILRVGPTPLYEGAISPDVDLYFLPMQCQHCENAPCVSVCPTGASHKAEDGTIQVDAETCIGCQVCMDACPYGVRSVNDTDGHVEKCTLCAQLTPNGELPQCVAQCVGRAKFFGDLDEGLESFQGPGIPSMWAPDGRYINDEETVSYDALHYGHCNIMDVVDPFTEDDIKHLEDDGNGPNLVYICREPHIWQGSEAYVPYPSTGWDTKE